MPNLQKYSKRYPDEYTAICDLLVRAAIEPVQDHSGRSTMGSSLSSGKFMDVRTSPGQTIGVTPDRDGLVELFLTSGVTLDGSSRGVSLKRMVESTVGYFSKPAYALVS